MDLQTLNTQIRELYSMLEEGGFIVSTQNIYRTADQPLPYAKISYKDSSPRVWITRKVVEEPALEHRVLATLADAILSGVALRDHLRSTGNEASIPDLCTEYTLDASNMSTAPLPPLPLEWKFLILTTYHANKGYRFLKAFEGIERVISG